MTRTERQAAFELLGVSPDSDPKVIRAAWRALVRTYHPDLAKSDPVAANRRLTEINAAFDLIAATPEAEEQKKPTAEPQARKPRATTPRAPKAPVSRAVTTAHRPVRDVTSYRFTFDHFRQWSDAEIAAARAAQRGFASSHPVLSDGQTHTSQKRYA